MGFSFLSDAYPFTAPMVIPLTKYRCTKGYSSRMGPVATQVMARPT